MARVWGWAGSVEEFLSTPLEPWLLSLGEHLEGLMGYGPSAAQTDAWRTENSLLTQTLRTCTIAQPEATGWGIVFEFELPLEGGRRPDVVLLAGDTICVLEFKSAAVPEQAHRDQVTAYARDLAEYHEGSHGRRVLPILVLPGARESIAEAGEVLVADPDDLTHFLLDSAGDGLIELESWLTSPYAPLPTLVEAARRIFQHQPLPHVKRALSAEIPQTLALISDIVDEAARAGSRLLIFLTGTPGSGKTLVGLRLVYERFDTSGQATFLSGNGPLVRVLQDALQSKVFVRDLHSYLRTYGINARTPKEHILVFDEAQRAWDREYMEEKRGVSASEPELLINIGTQIPEWSALVGLVGEGQEIYSGEEGGMEGWRAALLGTPEHDKWQVHCPPGLASELQPLRVETHPRLDLTVSLRSRRAERLHEWVAKLLDAKPRDLKKVAQLAIQIQGEGFPMYVTRDLDDARHYVRTRYAGEPQRRFGLIASSHSKTLPRHGVDNHFLATRKAREAKWFNAPPDDPDSCCALTQPLTEFGCQGLELDLPIVCWGEDYRWTGAEWHLTPKRRKYPLHDPRQLLTNTYRVLLTRGRDGMIVFLPAEESLDLTEVALLAAGVRPLPETMESYAA